MVKGRVVLALAGEEVQEPYPTTEALLDKLQEVLEKADVEVCSLQAVHCTALHCNYNIRFSVCEEHKELRVSCC